MGVPLMPRSLESVRAVKTPVGPGGTPVPGGAVTLGRRVEEYKISTFVTVVVPDETVADGG